MYRYFLSSLTNTYQARSARPDLGIEVGDVVLDQSRVTDTREFAAFDELRDHVLMALRYPHPQRAKHATYSWTPSRFTTSDREFRKADGTVFARHGSWRRGEAEIDAMSVFVADVDNASTDHPIVTQQQVTDALADQGWSSFTYTSFSSRPERPKFRVVIDIARTITRHEAAELYLLMNETVFGSQGDPTIYDPADHVYGPGGRSITTSFSGAPVDVDHALSYLAELRETDPERWQRIEQSRSDRVRGAFPPGVAEAHEAKLVELRKATEARPLINASNPDIVRPEWIAAYRDLAQGGHWQTMRSVMGKVWAKSGGTLTRFEMMQIAREIDVERAGYFFQHHGEGRASDLVNFIMRHPVAPREDWLALQQTSTAERILKSDDTGMTINVMEGACGEGKTFQKLKGMARERGMYVFACDKIISIAERIKEFRKIAGPDIVRWHIREAHCKNDTDTSVLGQLARIRADLAAHAYAGAPVIVFCTHAAATMANWSGWDGFELVVDEVFEVLATAEIDVRNNPDMLMKHLTVEATDGLCYRVEPTTGAWDKARSGWATFDDFEKVAYGVLSMVARPNVHAWVRRDGWENPTKSKLAFFSFTSPEALRPFARVTIMGDEATKSTTLRIWAEKYGVKFNLIDFHRRTRRVPVAQRLRVIYFSRNRDASRTRLSSPDAPLEAISRWIETHAAGEPVLWTINKSRRGHDDADHLPERDREQPRSHGRNDLQHYRRIAWFASMKPSPVEIGILRDACGISADEVSEWRELNSLYQFVMRGVLRDYDSEETCVVYVFSERQALYLQRRFGCPIEYVSGVIHDQPRKPSRVPTGTAMTPAERQRARRERLRAIHQQYTPRTAA